MGTKIFINYRRGDDPGFVQALFARLEQSFRSQDLFMDVDHITAGADFARVLDQKVAQCDVMLAVIGRGWLTASSDDGKPRLADPNDFVRIEIESAIRRGKLIVPVLVGGATLPDADELPEALRPLVRFNAVRLTHERFKADAQGLVSGVQTALREAEAARQAQERRQREEVSTRRELAGFRLAAPDRQAIRLVLVACAGAGALSGTLMQNHQLFAGFMLSLNIGNIYFHEMSVMPFYVPVLFAVTLMWASGRQWLPLAPRSLWLLAGTWIGWIVAVNIAMHFTQFSPGGPVPFRFSPQVDSEVNDPGVKQFLERVTSLEKFVSEAITFTLSGAVGAGVTVLGHALATQGRTTALASLAALAAGAVSALLSFAFSLGFAVMCASWQGLVGATLAWGMARSQKAA